MNGHIYCCCADDSCVLPGTGDTFTVSIRSSNSCAGCYDFNGAVGSVNDIDIDVDGDYTLSWSTDFSGRRLFVANNQAVTTGEIRVHSAAVCTGTNSLLSNGLLNLRIDFDTTTGCMVYMLAQLNQAADVITHVTHERAGGANYSLGVWHVTDHACGDETGDVGFSGVGTAISDATEMKVVLD